MAEKITISVIKADVGSYPGHVRVHPELLSKAEGKLKKAKKDGLLLDAFVTHCGDDLELIMTHRRGVDAPEIHELAWKTFEDCTAIARKMKLYGAGQDILSEAFSGNVKGLGPGVAEIEFMERASDPIVIFMADKTEPGAWNPPLYKIFADPYNTAGLIIDPGLHDGFIFEVHDVIQERKIEFNTPEDIYDLLAYIGQPGRYVIKSIRRKDGLIAAVASTQRLSLIAGKYVGKDDPVCIIRAQHGLPAVGEVIEPFASPHIVAGWMRGSHHGPLMPVSMKQAHPTRFDGPPRVIALGFQIAEGKLIGPVDLFDDPAFELAREKALEIADIMRAQGPFEPHRLSAEEMEYTTLSKVEEKLEKRWKKGI
ncbi:MAG: fructose-1,6-bisphosphatase [Euryarchaeota archaeon]|nr:fructose-1,6-bisphosphatase [Euryarchaeota archaeon]